MNVLVLGSGGREHSICWKLKQNPKLGHLFIAPGNAGTSLIGHNVDLNNKNFQQIGSFCHEHRSNMLVVGPEAPLVNGIADYFENTAKLSSIMVIGPSQKAAMLEGSKDYAKSFMHKYNIPTAAHKTFYHETLSEGLNYLETLAPPYVLKADGLASGKGVLICEQLTDAKKELYEMLAENKFGNASAKVLIEEFLSGIELSVFALTDGSNYVILPEAKDYKRIGENDTGLNTGGMGSVSPVPFADKAFMDKVESRIVIPTINGLKNENLTYKGFIFFGLINCQGNPYVIEYNVRMGDPEAQSVIPRIKTDLLDLFIAVANNKTGECSIETDTRCTATVIAVSGGYPGTFEKGKPITFKEQISDSLVFHAGTKTDMHGKIVTDGGRVLAITSFGKDLQQALSKSYTSIKCVSFDNMYFRSDLGFDLH